MPPRLAAPRGPLSDMLCARLGTKPGPIPRATRVDPTIEIDRDPLGSEDLQLALHLCYGLHYDGFAGVDDGWEWEASLLALRHELEAQFLGGLVAQAGLPGSIANDDLDLRGTVRRIRQLLDTDARSLSAYMLEAGDLEDLREFVIHRSIYQRKEADPHTWAIPRLRGRAKSALVTLQSDEYGRGQRGATHAELFGETMVALGLDPTPGAYIDRVPGTTLATDNLVSFFGLHRRWRGALVGHLAAFEMTSVLPMGRYAAALRRALPNAAGAEFYDVHVEADVRHEQIAVDDLIGGLSESDYWALQDVPFGVAALMVVEGRFSERLLTSWDRGASSLLAASADALVSA
jgi:Iron-containing redox enzyme